MSLRIIISSPLCFLLHHSPISTANISTYSTEECLDLLFILSPDPNHGLSVKKNRGPANCTQVILYLFCPPFNFLSICTLTSLHRTGTARVKRKRDMWIILSKSPSLLLSFSFLGRGKCKSYLFVK